MKPQPGTLVLAQTPYHAFLAAGRALGSPDDPHDLVMVTDFGEEKELAAALAPPAGPFRQWIPMPGNRDDEALTTRALRLAWVQRRIVRLARRTRPQRVLLFNDARPDSQGLIRWAAGTDPATPLVYLEDGSGAYSLSVVQYHQGRAFRLARRLIYGREFWERKILGTAPEIQELRVLFPSLVRPELRDRQPRAIDVTPFRLTPFRELCRRYLEGFGLQLSSLAGRDLLLAAHSSADLHPGDHGSLDHWIRSRETPPLVKYHPRESRGDYLRLARRGALVLPRRLGVEFLFSHPQAVPRSVLAPTSTVLITARWLLPDLPVHRLVMPGEDLDPAMERVFAALAVSPLPR